MHWNTRSPIPLALLPSLPSRPSCATGPFSSLVSRRWWGGMRWPCSSCVGLLMCLQGLRCSCSTRQLAPQQGIPSRLMQTAIRDGRRSLGGQPNNQHPQPSHALSAHMSTRRHTEHVKAMHPRRPRATVGCVRRDYSHAPHPSRPMHTRSRHNSRPQPSHTQGPHPLSRESAETAPPLVWLGRVARLNPQGQSQPETCPGPHPLTPSPHPRPSIPP